MGLNLGLDRGFLITMCTTRFAMVWQSVIRGMAKQVQRGWLLQYLRLYRCVGYIAGICCMMRCL